MPDEIKTTEQDALHNEQPSDSEKETTPKTYTEAEVKKFKSDALAEAGRKHKEELTSIAKERDDLKGKLSEMQSNVEETKSIYEKTVKRVKELEEDLETAIGDSADLKEIQAIKRKLRDAETQLESDYKDKVKALKTQEDELKKKHEEWDLVVAEVQTSKFELAIAEIAKEYGQTEEAARLKTLCETAGKKSKTEVEELASILWTKKPEKKAEETTMPTDSGSGGGYNINWDTASPSEKIAQGLKKGKK